MTPELPEGVYHYYLSDDDPDIPRYVGGSPDPSFPSRRADPPPVGHLRPR